MKAPKSAAANALPELVARFLAVLMFCLGIAICFGRGAHAAEELAIGPNALSLASESTMTARIP